MTDRGVPVWIIGVDQFQKRAIADRGRRIAHLFQTVQPQLADPFEIRLSQRRPNDNVADECERPFGHPTQCGDADRGRIGANVGVELRAEPRQRLVHFNRRPRIAAFVEHVRGDRGKTVLADRVGRGAAGDQQHIGNQRNLGVLDGPHAQAVR